MAAPASPATSAWPKLTPRPGRCGCLMVPTRSIATRSVSWNSRSTTDSTASTRRRSQLRSRRWTEYRTGSLLLRRGVIMAATNSDNDRRIDYVELDVADVARAKKFYGDVFGWTFKDYGPDYCEFRDGRLTGGLAVAGKARGAGW